MYRVKTVNKISEVIHQKLTPDHFIVTDEGENYDAAIVRSADMHHTVFPQELVAIARAGAGYNNIPVESCTENGIVVFNTPGANANAVRELVVCGMLLAGRKVSESITWLKEEKAAGTTGLAELIEKKKNHFVGPELGGKTLGVIGLGAIGVMVANAASLGLNMEVLGYDPYISVDAAWHLTRSIVQARTVEAVYKKSDFISLHLPLNENTKKMIGAKELAAMKPGAVLLNFARGGLVDDDAVLEALASGHLSHYVTDFPNDQLVGQDGVIAIPHLGASTPESEENCAVMASRLVRDFLLYGNIKNSVNLPDCMLPREGGVRVTVINRNIKNMIGQISAVLAESGCNIDNLINKSRGDWAYTILDLDKAPSQAGIEKLEQIDGVVRVRVI